MKTLHLRVKPDVSANLTYLSYFADNFFSLPDLNINLFLLKAQMKGLLNDIRISLNVPISHVIKVVLNRKMIFSELMFSHVFDDKY